MEGKNDKQLRSEHFEGFIPLMRRFRDNPLWTEKRKFSRAEAWIDLLFRARYSETPETIIDRGEQITLNEGDILTSIRSLSKDWRWSRTRVKNFISFLQQNGSLKILRLDHRRLIINVVKLGYFKRLIPQTGPQTLPQTGPQKSHRKANKNKVNKVNKVNNNIYIKEKKKKEKKYIKEKKEKEKKAYKEPKKRYSSLKEISDKEIKEIAERYGVSTNFVRITLEEMRNWLGAKGRRYKNYKMALMNWVLRKKQEKPALANLDKWRSRWETVNRSAKS